ncbi:MAG: hypothetical protein WD823_06650 [Sulfuricaulis sp.]|uniref:hypothetical protein n=1 Tax=Sulfuricaulis sp. TaxID=2003553 RepID=UPI0034A0E5BC
MTLANCYPQGLLTRLPALAVRWRTSKLDDAVFAAQYFLIWQIATHDKPFASRQCKSDPRPDAAEWTAVIETADGECLRMQLLDWLERYQFRSVIANVPAALAQWLRGAWPLVLREDILKPLEVLRMQARGKRAVTVLTAWPRLREPVLNKPDAFAFFRHDLAHAYKFYHTPALYAGQRAFFTALEAAIDGGMFAAYCDDAEFVAKFHYLMGDMNTHPVHSMQYLRAILVEYYLRREQKNPVVSLSSKSERIIKSIMHAFEATALRVACAYS